MGKLKAWGVRIPILAIPPAPGTRKSYAFPSRIRWRLNILDRYYSPSPDEDDHEELDGVDDALNELRLQEELPGTDIEKPPFDPIPLGSAEKPGDRGSAWIEMNGGYFNGFTKRAEFKDFHKELIKYLKLLKELYRRDFQAPLEVDEMGTLPVRVHGGLFPCTNTIQIFPYRNIKHSYVSFDDQLMHRENIRCSPSFFSRTRFDTVLVKVDHSYRPARLHLVFQVAAYGVTWQLARVTYFSALQSLAIDRTIGMQRYYEEEGGEFIHLASIVRSCYMTPIFTQARQFYLNDLVAGDVDLFLRVAL
jgi:hypothetical protein